MCNASLLICQNLTSGFGPLWHLDACVVEGGKGCSRNIIEARDLRGGIIPSCGASENFCQNLRSIIFIYRMTLIKELVSEDHHPAWSPPSPPPPPLILNLLTLERVSYYPVLGSEIVGSAKLRKHGHKNKAAGDWGEGTLPFSRHHLLFPDYMLFFSCVFHLCVIHTIWEPETDWFCMK